jgi:hypothetical protein
MNKNRKVLISFIAYCAKHPEQRFWQALRNWIGCKFIYLSNDIPHSNFSDLNDTFYFEEKDK